MEWTFSRRALTHSAALKVPLKGLQWRMPSRVFKPLEYLIKAAWTLAHLVAKSPTVVWIPQPPLPLLMTVLLFSRIRRRPVKVICDCHSATWRPPWINVFLARSLLKRVEFIVVHNDSDKLLAESIGITKERIHVLSDLPANFHRSAAPSAESARRRPMIIMPASFSADEPIAQVLLAARNLPDVSFVLTGNFRRRSAAAILTGDIPPNVRLTGYLSVNEFNGLLLDADAVLALTTVEGVQLASAAEAIGAQKPLITSDTRTLRQIYPWGVVHVDATDPLAIARGCTECLESLDAYRQASHAQRNARVDQWHQQLAGLGKALGRDSPRG